MMELIRIHRDVALEELKPILVLGSELSESKNFSESIARLNDKEISNILSDAVKRSTRILSENRDTWVHHSSLPTKRAPPFH